VEPEVRSCRILARLSGVATETLQWLRYSTFRVHPREREGERRVSGYLLPKKASFSFSFEREKYRRRERERERER